MKTKIVYFFTIGVLCFGLSSFNHVAVFKNGVWLAKLKTASGQFIPFNFELKDSAGKKMLTIINGKEKFKVNDVKVQGDSVLIKMPLFDSEIRAALKENTLEGNWVRHIGSKNVLIPFSAEANTAWRFLASQLLVGLERTDKLIDRNRG